MSIKELAKVKRRTQGQAVFEKKTYYEKELID